MITPNFKLPKTKMSLVVWYRNGKRFETLINTPATCAKLAETMFGHHRVGPSEIKAIKPLEPKELLTFKW